MTHRVVLYTALLFVVGLLLPRAAVSAQQSSPTLTIPMVTHFALGAEVEGFIFVETEPNADTVRRPRQDDPRDLALFAIPEGSNPTFERLLDAGQTFDKGEPLGLTLGDWLSATGALQITCNADGTSTVEAAYRNLVPGGVYTMWDVRLDPAIGLDPSGILGFVPLGAPDGSENFFTADEDGNGAHRIEVAYCLLAQPELVDIELFYHSDGETYGPVSAPPPNNLGVLGGVHLLGLIEPRVFSAAVPMVSHFALGSGVEPFVFVETEPGADTVRRARQMDPRDLPLFGVPAGSDLTFQTLLDPDLQFDKGEPLGFTLGEWLAAQGTMQVTCNPDGTSMVDATYSNLVPGGVYTMWDVRLNPATGLDPNGIIGFRPLGNANGSENFFTADESGSGAHRIQVAYCLLTQSELVDIELFYHSDGLTYGPISAPPPENLGVRGGVQLLGLIEPRVPSVTVPMLSHFALGAEVEAFVFVETEPGADTVRRPSQDDRRDLPLFAIPEGSNPTFERLLDGEQTFDKGAALDLTLGDWLSATGALQITCNPDGTSTVEAAYRNLIPGGVYTMWDVRLDPAIGLDPSGILGFVPLGAPDGSENFFTADEDGNGIHRIEVGYCLLAQGNLVDIELFYHSDGETYGPVSAPPPDNLGVLGGVQLLGLIAPRAQSMTAPMLTHLALGAEVEGFVFVETEPGADTVRRARRDDPPNLPLFAIPEGSDVAFEDLTDADQTFDKGEDLGFSLGEWLGADGSVLVTCNADGTSTVQAALRNLVPGGVYTLWDVRLDPAIGLDPSGILGFMPLGAPDGSENFFTADENGTGSHTIRVAFCLLTQQDVVDIELFYHSDGLTHGPVSAPPPDNLGILGGVQLLGLIEPRVLPLDIQPSTGGGETGGDNGSSSGGSGSSGNDNDRPRTRNGDDSSNLNLTFISLGALGAVLVLVLGWMHFHDRPMPARRGRRRR